MSQFSHITVFESLNKLQKLWNSPHGVSVLFHYTFHKFWFELPLEFTPSPAAIRHRLSKKIIFFRYIDLCYIISYGICLIIYLFLTKYSILGWIHTTAYIIILTAAICCLIINIKLYEASEDSSYNALIQLKDLFLRGIQNN